MVKARPNGVIERVPVEAHVPEHIRRSGPRPTKDARLDPVILHIRTYGEQENWARDDNFRTGSRRKTQWCGAGAEHVGVDRVDRRLPGAAEHLVHERLHLSGPTALCPEPFSHELWPSRICE